MLQLEPEAELPFLQGTSPFFLLRPSTDWVRPTQTVESNLLYSECIDLNVNLI